MKLRAATTALLILTLLFSPYFGIPGWTPPLATVAFFTAVCLAGLNLTFGYCGMLAFGQAAFAAIAAYTMGLLNDAGAPWGIAAAGGIGFSVLVARLLAVVFVQLPGTYLAIATLGLAYVVEGLTRAFPSTTGGASGLLLRSPFPIGEVGWYAIAFFCAIASVAATFALVRGGYARTLKLIRTDELSAEVTGINVSKEKTFVFTVGAAFTAVGGVLLSTYASIVTPEFGGANSSLEYLAMVIIGGGGTAWGPFVGAATIYWLFSVAGAAMKYELLIYGVCFLAVVLFAPQGIVGLLRPWITKALGNMRPNHAVAVAGTGTPLHAVPAPAKSLVVESVSKKFGGVTAVSEVSSKFSSGEVVGLLGPNGAGKTTLFNILSGIERPDAGNVILGDKSIVGLSINHRARVIGRAFQVPRLVPDMTVIENVATRADQIFPDLSEEARMALAYEQLQHLGLADIADQRAQDVAVGLHKLIDLARAAIGSPPLLLLDEPAVGLTAGEISRLREIILGFKARETIVVVVDHNMDFIRSVADRVVVMEGGRNIADGPCSDVLNDARVQKAYLGILQ